MKELSKIAMKIKASTTLQVDSLYKKMKKEGIDVVGFGSGEPDFNTPENINKAAIEAINDGKTRYTPASGLPELKDAITKRLQIDCNVCYDKEQIVTASGAKHSIFVALSCLLNPGDEVILPAPYWVTYIEAIKMTGGVPVVIETSEDDDFKINKKQLETAITDKTKLFIINNPSNPTGMIYDKVELQELCDICVKHDLYILSDEVYYRFVYDSRAYTSLPSLSGKIKERTILVNGVSKTYAMTGWRVGYTASNREIASIMGNFLSHSTSATSTISQIAAIAALNGPQDIVDEMAKVFWQRRDYIVSRINSISGISCKVPHGAFYIMMNIKKLIGKKIDHEIIQDSDGFSMLLLKKGRVATISCSGFGIEGFVRLTYATSMDEIKKGIDRIEEFVNKLR